MNTEKNNRKQIFEGRKSDAALGVFHRRSHKGLSRRVRAVSGDLGQRPRKYRPQAKNAVCGHLWRFVRAIFLERNMQL